MFQCPDKSHKLRLCKKRQFVEKISRDYTFVTLSLPMCVHI